MKKVKEAGFTNNPSNMSVNETIMYFADNDEMTFNVGVGYSDNKFVIMVLNESK